MKIAFPDSVLARCCIPALVAVGGSLATLPAAALELGDLTVHSKLGQPLRASIAYALAPNEQLSELCISLHSGQSFVGLVNVARVSVSIANGVIKLTGNTPIREPMITARISVNCPYTANVSREYTLFIDPETRVDAPSVTAMPATAPVAANAIFAANPVRTVTAVVAKPEVTPVPVLTLKPEVTFVADEVVEKFTDTGVTTGDLKPGDIILDTPLTGPATQTTNNAPSDSWLVWLAGSGVAIISALLLFSRRLRKGTGSTPVASHANQSRRRITDVDDEHGLSVDTPTVEKPALDIELPFDAHPIASDETGDYDMSVIMDATKMPRPEDITRHDLQAVEVDISDDSEFVENYTISQEVDYRIIEQDYEDEMTATQALNEEIARAAAEVIGLLDADESTDDETAALPLASVTELDVTAQLPQPEAEISDLDDTGINEAIKVKLSTDDKTAEMPVADNDGDTVEMPAKSGKAG